MIHKSDSGRRIYFYDNLPTEVAGIFSGGVLLALCGAGFGFVIGEGLAGVGLVSAHIKSVGWIYGATILPGLWWALIIAVILSADERVNLAQLAEQWIALNRHLPAVAKGISHRAARALAMNALLKDKEESR